MYLSELDIIGISIALVSLMALVLTSSVANARLTRQRDDWRDDALWWNAIADENRDEADRLQDIINKMSPTFKE